MHARWAKARVLGRAVEGMADQCTSAPLLPRLRVALAAAALFSAARSESQLKHALNVPAEQIASIGTAFGKFTKTGKFRLTITCLDHLAQYAKYKVWVKPAAELTFLYGNSINKNGLGRITENTPQYQGVVILSMSDVPLGFGVTARSTQECRNLAPTDIVCFHQADIGEYLRDEETMT